MIGNTLKVGLGVLLAMSAAAALAPSASAYETCTGNDALYVCAAALEPSPGDWTSCHYAYAGVSVWSGWGGIGTNACVGY